MSKVDPALDDKRKKERARKFAKTAAGAGSGGVTAADSADGEGDRQPGKHKSGGLASSAKDVARKGKRPKGRTLRQ